MTFHACHMNSLCLKHVNLTTLVDMGFSSLITIRSYPLLAPSLKEYGTQLTLSDGQQAAICEHFALCTW